MDSYREETYGERIAPVYDELFGGYEPETIEALNRLAHGGPALELGIGTGRIAVPLQQSGIPVRGIDISEPMVAKLRAKPGGQDIPVTIGSFADVPVEGKYRLIYVCFNTFFGLLSQGEGVRCFANVAQHLEPSGVFVLECFFPDLARFSRGQNVSAVSVDQGEVRLDVSRLDPVNQWITAQHMVLTEQGTKLYPVKIRYVWPSEMDLMARLGGMRLQARWGNWKGDEFTASSGKHVSIYELASVGQDRSH